MTIRSFEADHPEIDQTTYVDQDATVIGQVRIGRDSSIWPGVVIRGDVNQIVIGDRSSIQDGTIIHATHAGPFTGEGYSTHIGDEVTVGHQAVIHGCQIKSRVLVGISAVILDGAIVESDVMIGAGSLIPPNKHLQSGYLYFGQPVKKVRVLTEQEKQYLRYTANNYVNLAKRHLTSI